MPSCVVYIRTHAHTTNFRKKKKKRFETATSQQVKQRRLKSKDLSSIMTAVILAVWVAAAPLPEYQ